MPKLADDWTTTSWNPVTGCDRVSTACDHCYALQFAERLKAMGQPRYAADGDARTSGPGFGLTLPPDLVDLPRRWRTPRHAFVGSMSDLFHVRVPPDFIRAVVATMRSTPQHTYQVLTKRAKRLERLSEEIDWPADRPAARHRPARHRLADGGGRVRARGAAGGPGLGSRAA